MTIHDAHRHPGRPTAATLTLREPGDLVPVIPYLTGYDVDEGVVVLVLVEHSIRLTASFGSQVLQAPRWYADQMATVAFRHPGADYLVVAFHPDPDTGRELAELTVQVLPAGRVTTCLHTDRQRYWTILGEDPTPGEGIEVDTTCAAVAEAIYHGRGSVGSRQVLVARVAGPPPELHREHARLADGLVATWHLQSGAAQAGRLDELQAIGVAEPDLLTTGELLELAVLVGDIAMRDRAWLRMQRADADLHLALWLRVVSVAPDTLAVPVLCLTGIAGWLTGDGATLSVCLERAHRLNPRYSLLRILDDIVRDAVPPVEWDDWRAQMADEGLLA